MEGERYARGAACHPLPEQKQQQQTARATATQPISANSSLFGFAAEATSPQGPRIFKTDKQGIDGRSASSVGECSTYASISRNTSSSLGSNVPLSMLDPGCPHGSPGGLDASHWITAIAAPASHESSTCATQRSNNTDVVAASGGNTVGVPSSCVPYTATKAAAAAVPPSGTVTSINPAAHYKTKRCRHFDRSGWCPFQHRCIFAHGDREYAFYTAHQNTLEAGGSTDSVRSQQARGPIERNVSQLLEEYSKAVAEATASALSKRIDSVSPTGGSGVPEGRLAEDAGPPPMMAAMSHEPSAPHSASTLPSGAELPPPPLPASNRPFLVTSPPSLQLRSDGPFSSRPAVIQREPGSSRNPPMLRDFTSSQSPLITPANAAIPPSTYRLLVPAPTSASLLPFPLAPTYQLPPQEILLAIPAGQQGLFQLPRRPSDVPVYFVETPYPHPLSNYTGTSLSPGSLMVMNSYP